MILWRHNTRLIREYVSIDPRILPLATMMQIKLVIFFVGRMLQSQRKPCCWAAPNVIMWDLPAPHKMTLRQWWNALFLNIQYIWCCNEGLYISMPRVPTSAHSINESILIGSCRYTPSRSIKQEFGLIFHILLLRT